MFGNETYYTELSLKQKSSELLPLGASHLSPSQLRPTDTSCKQRSARLRLLYHHNASAGAIDNYQLNYNILYKS